MGRTNGIKWMRSYCVSTEAVTSTYLTRASWHLDRTYFSAVLLEVSAFAHSPRGAEVSSPS